MAALNIQLQPGDIQTDMVPDRFNEPVSLFRGNSLYSPSGAFRFTLQDDGNAVLQVVDDSSLPPIDGTPLAPEDINWVPVWAAYTQDPFTGSITMQLDGNLVVYRAGGGAISDTPIWSSGTDGNYGSFCRMQDDGNLVIYNSDNIPVFQTNTSVRTSAGMNA